MGLQDFLFQLNLAFTINGNVLFLFEIVFAFSILRFLIHEALLLVGLLHNGCFDILNNVEIALNSYFVFYLSEFLVHVCILIVAFFHLFQEKN